MMQCAFGCNARAAMLASAISVRTKSRSMRHMENNARGLPNRRSIRHMENNAKRSPEGVDVTNREIEATRPPEDGFEICFLPNETARHRMMDASLARPSKRPALRTRSPCVIWNSPMPYRCLGQAISMFGCPVTREDQCAQPLFHRQRRCPFNPAPSCSCCNCR